MCIKTGSVFVIPVCDEQGVRKHRAPKGALRRLTVSSQYLTVLLSQKAPSTIRCIKTREAGDPSVLVDEVRKHQAPKGALRLVVPGNLSRDHLLVRKHRAPKGALRQRARPEWR